MATSTSTSTITTETDVITALPPVGGDSSLDDPPPPLQKLGVFDITFYVTMPGILVVSGCVLVNIVVELKRSKPHHRILLGLCISDIIGSAFGFPYPGLRRSYDTRPETCAVVIFFVRMGILGGTCYVMLLSAERFLALQAPFWYDLHVTGGRSVVVSVAAGVLIVAVSAFTFVGRSHVSPEIDASGNATSRELCSIFPVDVREDVAHVYLRLYLTVTLLNLILIAIFNVRVVLVLMRMRSQVEQVSRNPHIPAGSARQETTLLRMVIVFSVVSIVTNLPSAMLNTLRVFHRGVPDSLRLVSTAFLSMGFVLDPCIHLVFTAKYRRRIRRWLRCRFREAGQPDAPVTSVNGASREQRSRKAGRSLDSSTTNTLPPAAIAPAPAPAPESRDRGRAESELPGMAWPAV